MALKQYKPGRVFTGVMERTPWMAEGPSQLAAARSRFTYYPGTQMVPGSAGSRMLNQRHSITADVEVPEGGGEGALLSAGDIAGGFCFYMQGGTLHYVYNYGGSSFYHLESTLVVAPGRHAVSFEFETTGKPGVTTDKGAPGFGRLYVDGALVGQGEIALTMPLTIGICSGIVCGADPGSPVWHKYRPPFRFNGRLHEVTIDVSGALITDTKSEMRIAIARQ